VSFPFALIMAAPHAATAVAASLPLLDRLARATGIPFGILAVALVQVVGVGLARELELAVWGRVWLMNLGVCAVLVPLLAVQTVASRVPYAAREWGGFAPVAWSTLGVAVVTVALIGLAATLAAEEPEEASILALPVALLVPTLLAAPGALGEGDTLALVAQAFAVATAAALVGWLLPTGLRPLVGPVALAAQIAGLWVLGRGPRFHAERDTLVPVLGAALLALTIVATVLAPLLSVWLRRVLRAATSPEPHGRAVRGPDGSDLQS